MNPRVASVLTVAGLPFACSLLLSFATHGTTVFWQDSGIFLSGIKELSVLYPHGFVLYQLTAWLWTKLLGWLDFTLAVHLYSAVCTAGACAALGLASRDLLRSRHCGSSADSGASLRDWAAAAVGCLAAAGFTMASAAITAKGYALTYLVLALLLWFIVRAAEQGRPSDWTGLAALIGLAWAAHPSTTLAGGALLLFTAVRGRALGVRGLAWRAGFAALLAAGPSLLLLPWLSSRDSLISMGHPAGGGALLEYFLGGRYLGKAGVWGTDLERTRMLGLFAWEEFLGVGLLLVIFGLVRLFRTARPSFLFVSAWFLPYTAVALLFRIEGQLDFWLLAAALPLYLAAAVGLRVLVEHAGAHARLALSGVTAAGLVWALGVNYADLSQRGYTLAEEYGRLFLQPLAPRAVVLLFKDDAIGAVHYLQTVKGERSDVVAIPGGRLGDVANGRPWFDELLLRRHPEFKMPDYAGALVRAQGRAEGVWVRAFVAANLESGRPIYLSNLEVADIVPQGWEAVPCGVLWRIAPKGSLQPDAAQFQFPYEPEQMPPLYRRVRGIELFERVDGLDVDFEPYERRLATAVLRARQNLGEWQLRRGNPAAAVKLLESVLAFEPDLPRNPWSLQLLGLAHLETGNLERARVCLQLSVERSTHPRFRVVSLLALGDLMRRRGDEASARRCYEEGAALPDLGPEHRQELERRLRPR